jgi:Cu/Ag efflux protein CusF
MKPLVPAVATLFLASVSLAYAADATGMIKAIDMTKGMVTLDDGSTFVAPSTVKLSTFKVGEKVSVDYMTNAGKNEIKTMKPAA